MVRSRRRIGIALGVVIVLVATLVGVRALRTPAARRSAAGPSPSTWPVVRPTRAVTFAEGCTTAGCHTAVAGAGLSRGGSAMRDAHTACEACHSADVGGHRYPLKRENSQVCVTCHDTGSHRPVQHKAMTDDGCLACHAAHVTNAGSQLIAASVRETCTKCHPHDRSSVEHAPHAAERCDVCHDSHGGETRGLLRMSSVAETCRTCHPATVARAEAASHTHRGVEGSCLACHAPHTSQFKGLLPSAAREVCVSCHADVGSVVAGATVSHEPVLKGEQCVRCHDPHASEHPGMLRLAQTATCMSCHDKVVKTASGRPVAAMVFPSGATGLGARGHDECSECHSVHGGTHAGLLNAANLRVPLGPYDRKNYALCFSCHDERLAEVASATQFRNGDRNLHSVHLRMGDQSRGCATCHAVHGDGGAGEPRLIAKAVNFEGSSWTMPMGFVLTEEGGRCGSGCHEPMEYRRALPTPRAKSGADARESRDGGNGGRP